MNNLKIVIDTANGAAYDVAPKVFRELGAEVTAISDDPNGLNINQNCGSTDLNVLKKAVLDNNADFGIAFDGDGDRLIIVDSEAKALDGDDILFLLAKFKFENQIVLGSKGVVGTDMTNKGLENALSEMGIELVRSKVGDKYVLKKLLELGWQLGGEQSGHIICLDSVVPFSESTTLITEGFYKYTRNPMYVGMNSFLLGLLIILNNPINFIFLL